MDDIHDYARRADKYLQKIRASGFSQRNKDLIERFTEDCYSDRLTPGRIYKHLYHLNKIVTLLAKDFDVVDIHDLKHLLRILDTGWNYRESTKKDFRITIKKFWKWMNNGTLPDAVKWIRVGTKLCEKRMPEEVLSQEDVMTLIKAADNPRDKAFIFVLYESGCRIGEMMGIRLKHVNFDQYGATLSVNGKTGSRRARIILGCDYLRYWLENHPRRGNPEAYLWVNLSNSYRGEQLSYRVTRERLRGIARRAGITKKVNFHNFRHARATHLAGKLTESQLCEIFGWTLSSKMPATYVHLSGRNVDEALLRVYGIKENEEENRNACPRCHASNDQISKYCYKCGLPFGLDAALIAEEERGKQDDMMTKLMEDSEMRKAILGAIKRLKL